MREEKENAVLSLPHKTHSNNDISDLDQNLSLSLCFQILLPSQKGKKMRVLNLNFLSCAVKACKATNKAFPLHPKDAELAEDDEVAYKPEILVSILPRLDWEALRTTCTEVSPVALHT